MAQKQEEKSLPFGMFDELLTTVTQFWDGVMISPSSQKKKGQKKEETAFPWQEALNGWQALQEETFKSVLSDSMEWAGHEAMKQWGHVAASGWEAWQGEKKGMFPFDTMGGTSVANMALRDMSQRLFSFFSEEVSRLVSLPALGLSRNYHEKMAGVVEKSNYFFLTLSEYLSMMFTPFEGAGVVVQESLKRVEKESQEGVDTDKLYTLWVEELEKGYFALYSSKEYLNVLKRVVEAMGEYTLARQVFVGDCLRLMGIPSEGDLDDLYKDIYLLKKRVSELESTKKKKR